VLGRHRVERSRELGGGGNGGRGGARCTRVRRGDDLK
jgi:hypothetical protein